LQTLQTKATGTKLPDLINEGTANDLLSGKQLIDQNGDVVVGSMKNNGAISYTMDGINTKSINVPAGYTNGGTVKLDNTIDNEVNAQANLITQIKDVANNLPEAKVDVEIKLQDKVITANGSYTADSGYDGFNIVTVSVSSIPNLQEKTATKNGEIIPDAGYDGLSKVIVNVASSGGGTNDDITRKILNKTITEYSDSELESIGEYGFRSCNKLISVDIPSVVTLGNSAFHECRALESINAPSVTTIGNYGVCNCIKLASANFPLLTTIGTSAFDGCNAIQSINIPLVKNLPATSIRNCRALTSIDLPLVTSIGANAFYYCNSLKYIILRSDSLCTLAATSAFSNCTALTNIYVPSNLVDSYKTATNWSTYADLITSLDELV
jgi:hypothetical protein